MLSEQQIAEGWLPHDGGPCPVVEDSYPAVMKKRGKAIGSGCVMAGVWAIGLDNWKWQGHPDNHIIAYKPEPKP